MGCWAPLVERALAVGSVTLALQLRAGPGRFALSEEEERGVVEGAQRAGGAGAEAHMLLLSPRAGSVARGVAVLRAAPREALSGAGALAETCVRVGVMPLLRGSAAEAALVDAAACVFPRGGGARRADASGEEAEEAGESGAGAGDEWEGTPYLVASVEAGGEGTEAVVARRGELSVLLAVQLCEEGAPLAAGEMLLRLTRTHPMLRTAPHALAALQAALLRAAHAGGGGAGRGSDDGSDDGGDEERAGSGGGLSEGVGARCAASLRALERAL